MAEISIDRRKMQLVLRLSLDEADGVAAGLINSDESRDQELGAKVSRFAAQLDGQLAQTSRG